MRQQIFNNYEHKKVTVTNTEQTVTLNRECDVIEVFSDESNAVNVFFTLAVLDIDASSANYNTHSAASVVTAQSDTKTLHLIPGQSRSFNVTNKGLKCKTAASTATLYITALYRE